LARPAAITVMAMVIRRAGLNAPSSMPGARTSTNGIAVATTATAIAMSPPLRPPAR